MVENEEPGKLAHEIRLLGGHTRSTNTSTQLTSSMVLKSLKETSSQARVEAGSTKSLLKVVLKLSQTVSMLLFTFRAQVLDLTMSKESVESSSGRSSSKIC